VSDAWKGPIGVSIRAEYEVFSPEKIIESAQVAEKRGFDSVWTAESWGLDAVAVLGYIAACTERVTFGSLILNVYSRTPELLAMSAMTLNDLSKGRFILGLGASTKALIEGWHGLKFDKPAARMRDTVTVVKQLLTGGTNDYEGETLAASGGYRLRFQPINGPVPIYLGVLGPLGVKLTAELCDGWLPALTPMRALREITAQIRAQSKAAGRPENAVTVAPSIVTCCGDDGDEAREAARRHLAFYLGAMGPHYRGIVSRAGFEEEVERIRVTWANKERDASRLAVTDEMVDQITISGTVAECRAKLAQFRAAGADHPILSLPGTCTNRMVELAIENLAAPAAERAKA